MAGMVSRQCGVRNPLPSIPHSAFHTPHSTYRTTMLPDPLFPSLVAVTSADPVPTAQITAVWPNAPSSPPLAVRPSIYTPHSALHIPHCYDRPSHRVVAVGRRADRGPARAARSEDRARPGERGGGGGRDPHPAAAWCAAHRDRGGDGSRRGHAGAAGRGARPFSRPARRVGAAARGDAAHRRELALGARPHGAWRGGDAGQRGGVSRRGCGGGGGRGAPPFSRGSRRGGAGARGGAPPP